MEFIDLGDIPQANPSPEDLRRNARDQALVERIWAKREGPARFNGLGLVGSTGRLTGPHLHLGVRWHDARIDPQFLLDDPTKIPAIGH